MVRSPSLPLPPIRCGSGRRRMVRKGVCARALFANPSHALCPDGLGSPCSCCPFAFASAGSRSTRCASPSRRLAESTDFARARTCRCRPVLVLAVRPRRARRARAQRRLCGAGGVTEALEARGRLPASTMILPALVSTFCLRPSVAAAVVTQIVDEEDVPLSVLDCASPSAECTSKVVKLKVRGFSFASLLMSHGGCCCMKPLLLVPLARDLALPAPGWI